LHEDDQQTLWEIYLDSPQANRAIVRHYWNATELSDGLRSQSVLSLTAAMDGIVIGVVSLLRPDFRSGKVYLGYLLDRVLPATAVCQVIVDTCRFAKRQWELRTVLIEVDSVMSATIRNHLQPDDAAVQLEGTLKDHFFALGAYHDLNILAIPMDSVS